MRVTALAWAALVSTTGCLRFGYAADPNRLDAGFDASAVHPDGSTSPEPAADGGKALDAAGMDSAIAVPADSGAAGNPALDASSALDAGSMDSSVPDAAIGDSGASDAGITDTGTDSGAVDAHVPDPGTTDPVDPIWTEDCPGMPGVLFCDDFEDSLAKWTYPVHVRGSTAVTTDIKRAGSYAFRATTSASTSTVQAQARRGVKVFGHRKSGELWARYYFYLPSSVSLTDKFSTGVISEYEEPWHGFSVVIHPDGVGLESRSVTRKTTLTKFPRDRWVCVEMHVVIDASSGVFEYYFDGGFPVLSLLELNTLPAMGYTSFEIGVHYANFNQGPITVYADDVKLGTSRIGCD